MDKKTRRFLNKIAISSRKRILYTLHAIKQMNLPERLISKEEIREVIEKEEIIEYYPDDPRGASCLMWGKTKQNRIVHVLCSPNRGFLLIITAYLPYPEEWESNYKNRRK